VRYFGEIANTPEAVAKLARQLNKGDARLSLRIGGDSIPMPINHLSVLLAGSQALPFQAGAMEQLNLRKLAA
jgi:hypothetical protein